MIHKRSDRCVDQREPLVDGPRLRGDRAGERRSRAELCGERQRQGRSDEERHCGRAQPRPDGGAIASECQHHDSDGEPGREAEPGGTRERQEQQSRAETENDEPDGTRATDSLPARPPGASIAKARTPPRMFGWAVEAVGTQPARAVRGPITLEFGALTSIRISLQPGQAERRAGR